MDAKEIIKKVRKIEIKTRKLSNHIFSGEYHSAFKGRGMTFSEVRPYQFGDDVRTIDWNKTAQFNEPYVKIFEEERELTLMLMVDISQSVFFGTRKQLKRETITEIAATLAFAAIQNNDKVGLLLFSNEIELYIPPKKGRSHVLRIIRELIEFKPSETQTDLVKAFQFLGGILKRHAILFTLSDFTDLNYKKALDVVARKHDVTGIRIYDKKEQSIPNIGLVYMQDMETGKIKAVNTSSKKVRLEYAKYYQKRYHYFVNSFTKAGAGTLNLQSDEDYVKKLMGYFKRHA
ncbi:uncharacterized protein UJ101_01137 [Flavobacteriaceae bacterium UJ101]|nr:uncharacterized protein UJ101_01137 [Flavobacteriaceae bacterium UJ101]